MPKKNQEEREEEEEEDEKPKRGRTYGDPICEVEF